MAAEEMGAGPLQQHTGGDAREALAQRARPVVRPPGPPTPDLPPLFHPLSAEAGSLRFDGAPFLHHHRHHHHPFIPSTPGRMRLRELALLGPHLALVPRPGSTQKPFWLSRWAGPAPLKGRGCLRGCRQVLTSSLIRAARCRRGALRGRSPYLVGPPVRRRISFRRPSPNVLGSMRTGRARRRQSMGSAIWGER